MSIFSISGYEDHTFEVTSIENLTSEHEEIMEIDKESDFDLESKDFNLDQIIDSAVDWVSSPSVPNPKTNILILPSNESTPSLELKALPEHLKYTYLGERETLSVIIAPRLSEKLEKSLMLV